MINKVTFTGRETMLTSNIKPMVSKYHEYVAASKIYTEAERSVAQVAESNMVAKVNEYVSPFLSVATKEDSSAKAANLSWAVSHGTPASEANRLINYLG